MRPSMNTFDVREDTVALTAHREAWDALALRQSSPFLTCAWLHNWARHRGAGRPLCATLCGPDGSLLAGGLFRRTAGGLAAAADVHSGDWDVVASDADSRRELWDHLARTGPLRFHLVQMRTGSHEVETGLGVLRRAGYGVLPSVRETTSPYIPLSGGFDRLLASRSRNARKQVRRHRRDLDAVGRVRFRTSGGGADFDRDFDDFLRVEASGWKGEQGTAIASSGSTRGLYRDFAEEADRRGWLRLQLLELDGVVVAAGLVVAFAGEGFFLKTGFDDALAELAPGQVLTAEILRDAAQEGLRGMDMLGRADQYKMSWTDEVRPRQRFRVYKGPPGRAAQHVWNQAARPGLVVLRDRARDDPRLRRRLERLQALVER